MGFIDDIKLRAKQNKKTIVLPEAGDRRTLEAANTILLEGIADIMLIGNEDEISKGAEGLDLSKATIIDPSKADKLDTYVDLLVELRKVRNDSKSKRIINKPAIILWCYHG